MEPLTQLRSNVHQLLNDHTQRHSGTFRYDGRTYSEEAHGIVPGLIQQLRDSMSSSSGDGSGGGGQVRQSLINVGAIQLFDRISDTAAAKYVGLTRTAPRASLEGNITGWTSRCVTDKHLIDEAATVTSRWVADITALLNPQRSVEIVGACPACGYAKYWVDVDGEARQASTLVAVGATVTCQYEECGASWAGAELHWLRSALDTDGSVVA